MRKDEPIRDRFATADLAVSWYNAWLATTTPPKNMEGCRMCSEEFGGWDPVVKWQLPDGTPIYWYVVGTGDTESLVIEGEETVRGWANQYYRYYAAVNGKESAEKITPKEGLPVRSPPEDLLPSTPESVYWTMLYAEQVDQRGGAA